MDFFPGIAMWEKAFRIIFGDTSDFNNYLNNNPDEQKKDPITQTFDYFFGSGSSWDSFMNKIIALALIIVVGLIVVAYLRG